MGTEDPEDVRESGVGPSGPTGDAGLWIEGKMLFIVLTFSTEAVTGYHKVQTCCSRGSGRPGILASL